MLKKAANPVDLLSTCLGFTTDDGDDRWVDWIEKTMGSDIYEAHGAWIRMSGWTSEKIKDMVVGWHKALYEVNPKYYPWFEFQDIMDDIPWTDIENACPHTTMEGMLESGYFEYLYQLQEAASLN